MARNDREIRVAPWRHAGRPHLVDRGERREIGLEGAEKALDRVRLTLDLDEHAAFVVPDEAAEREPMRHRVHERPEAHPLDDTADLDSHALGHAGSVIPREARR
jgi:hypothetical protein